VSARREVDVELEGRRLRLSNLDKVFYPATGFTKGQVVDYYIRVAPALLPHLRDRPLTLKRYPDGAQAPFFYEKRCPSHRPPWVRTEAVRSESKDGVIHFCVVDDLATLVWLANLADLELHTYLHRAPALDRPTMLVFDLDPGPPADAVTCCEVALLLRALLDRLELASFPKTSGSKGVQVYVPLNTPVDYESTKAFARAVAEQLEAERPDLVVSSMKKALRAGKVLVDWSQNDAHKTTVCAWSLRAKERPTVSTPVRWTEIESALRARDAARLAFEAPAALARFQRDGDPFAPVLELQQELPRARQGVTAARAPRSKLRGAARIPSGAAPPPPTGAARRPRDTASESGSGRRRKQPPAERVEGAGGRASPTRRGARPPARRQAGGRTPPGHGHPRRGDGYLCTE
jgi:bifunctional non-homologous end joining protein LigD